MYRLRVVVKERPNQSTTHAANRLKFSCLGVGTTWERQLLHRHSCSSCKEMHGSRHHTALLLRLRAKQEEGGTLTSECPSVPQLHQTIFIPHS
jgi:hypothetical protein